MKKLPLFLATFVFSVVSFPTANADLVGSAFEFAGQFNAQNDGKGAAMELYTGGSSSPTGSTYVHAIGFKDGTVGFGSTRETQQVLGAYGEKHRLSWSGKKSTKDYQNEFRESRGDALIFDGREDSLFFNSFCIEKGTESINGDVYGKISLVDNGDGSYKTMNDRGALSQYYSDYSLSLGAAILYYQWLTDTDPESQTNIYNVFANAADYETTNALQSAMWGLQTMANTGKTLEELADQKDSQNAAVAIDYLASLFGDQFDETDGEWWLKDYDPINDIFFTGGYSVFIVQLFDAEDGRYLQDHLIIVDIDGSTGTSTPTPEPATLLLFGLGVTCVPAIRRRTQKA